MARAERARKLERTRDMVNLFDKHVQTRPDIINNPTIMGFGFSRDGWLQQVIVQTKPASRGQVDDILNLHLRSHTGNMQTADQ